MEPMFADAVFEPLESAALIEAYNIAIAELEAEFVLDEQAKSKLTKIVVAIGHLRIGSGGGLKSSKDVENIALIAINRLKKLRAG